MRKHYTYIILAVLCLAAGISNAQDARHRTVTTIVADALAQMPVQNEADFTAEFKDLADSAPESVAILTGMLRPAKDTCNALMEYAIAGLVRYATRPENAKCLSAVKEGFVKAITNANDIYNLQFLTSQYRLLCPENSPAVSEKAVNVQENLTKYAQLIKSPKDNERCQALWLLAEADGAKCEPELLKALSDPSGACRANALIIASQYIGESFAAKAATKFNKLTNDAKADVLNYIGENGITSQQGLVLKNLKAKGKLGATAIEAASKLATPSCATALASLLKNKDLKDKALEALACFHGTIPESIASVVKGRRAESFKLPEGDNEEKEYDKIYAKAAEAAKKEVKAEVNALTDEEKEQGFELLFDGTSMDKWTGNLIGYTPVDGTIYVSAKYGNESNLYTKKEYRDFIFRFEFCFMKEGVNNGVGVRTPMGVDAAYDGMCEVQILDHDAPIYKDLREYQVHGSVYGVIPAKRIVHKPLGQWECEEIRVQGDHITVTVNGEVIVDGNIREACQGHNVAPDGSDENPYTVDHRNHPGMFNERGHIGFLGHGEGVKFKNIRVLDLEKK